MAKFKRWWWLPQLVGENLECTQCGSTRLGYACNECWNTVCSCCMCPLCNRMEYWHQAKALLKTMGTRVRVELVSVVSQR